jgi:4-hydroxybenzoate polyprenyltransferase
VSPFVFGLMRMAYLCKMSKILTTGRQFASLVVFSHTVFALPFAALAFTLGMLSRPDAGFWLLGLQVLLCMVFARNTAMSFNRLIDAAIDARNPRTAIRELPAGVLRRREVTFFVVVNAALFVLVAGTINGLCLVLSPVALAVIMGYSYTKRFTALCHLVLGLGLGLAPVGAYIAVTGTIEWPLILLGAGVMSWVGGFDIIYALQDIGFDREEGLHSIPQRLGAQRALWVSRLLHGFSFLMILGFVLMQWSATGGHPLLLGLALLLFLAMLVYQHSLVSAEDLSRVGRAFFTANGIASALFCALAIAGFVGSSITL